MEDFERIYDRLLSKDEEVRRQALACLAPHPFSLVRDHLFRAMGDESWRVRKEAVEVFLARSDASQAAGDLVDLLRSHDNAGLRNSAVEALTRLGTASLRTLHRHAGDEDHDVRKFVIDIMGSIADHLSVPILLQALDDPDLNVCAAAAENLGKIGDPRAIPLLLEMLKRSDLYFRYTVLEALGKIGKPVPTDIFSQLAADNLLKKAVYDCLAAIGDAASAAILIEGLKSRMKNAREAAANALVRVRDRLTTAEAERSVDPLLRELKGSPHLEGIMALLDSSDSNVKEVAVRLLAIIGDERSTGLLLRECGDERLRRYAVQAFRGMGDAGMAALVGMFPNVDQEGRTIIAYLCGEMGGASSAPILRDGMRDNYPALRRAAVEAIGRLGLGQLIPDISQLLQDPQAEVREGAIGALTRLAESNAAPVLQVAQRLSSSLSGEERRDAALLFSALAAAEHLSRLVKDEDSQVRQTAVAALAGMNHKASLGPLVMALADENPEVRISAATALGEMGSEEVYQPLLLALRDEDPWVQCAALKSIGRMGNDRAMHAITSIIDRADGLVMLTALESLSAIGSPVALSLVKKGLAHTDEEVVKEAIAILAEHGDGWIEEYRERLMAHPHWDVRRHFIMAMVQVQGKKALPHLKQALEREQDDMVKSQLVTIVENLR